MKKLDDGPDLKAFNTVKVGDKGRDREEGNQEKAA